MNDKKYDRPGGWHIPQGVVDRFEVIDETGRAYVRGSIYGSPVKVELDVQDDGKTLKAFVSAIQEDEVEPPKDISDEERLAALQGDKK